MWFRLGRYWVVLLLLLRLRCRMLFPLKRFLVVLLRLLVQRLRIRLQLTLL